MTRMTVTIFLVAMISVAAVGFCGEEAELDPLLELLVEQGVITREQALSVQAEYDRRREAECAPAVIPPLAPTQQVAMTAETEQQPGDEEKPEKWYDRIEFKGDLRLRGEFFWVEGISPNDRRERFRARIRPGIYTDITEWMEVGLQVRSGDSADPVSDNSSFDGGFALIPVSISEAYAAFHPINWLDLTFGKFDAKAKWTVTDMQWDDDVTVEGAMEEFSFGPFKANLYQYILEEDKKTRDAYLLGGQIAAKFDSEGMGSFTVGAGYDEWIRPQMVADLTLGGKLLGNPVTNLLDDEDQLISDFEIVNAFTTWSWEKDEQWPVKFSVFGYLNTGARGPGEDYDTGYFVRLQVGDYKKKGQMMFRASRYYSEPDALFYVFAQSDTTMASDVDGYRFDYRLGFVKKSYFNLTWYHTKPVYSLFPEMDRIQMDYIIVF
ncbi:MAG: putative porin [Acidobacteriota bacterium]